MTLYEIFKHLHSGFRFVVMILLIVAVLQAVAGWLNKKPYTGGNRKVNLFTMISAHIQLLLGIVLYFLSPYVQFNSGTMKNFDTRYWTVEHQVMMILAIVLITVGYSRSKKLVLPEAKHRIVAIFFILALVVIIAAIAASRRSFIGVSA